MVCRLTLNKSSFARHHSTVKQLLDRLASLRRLFLEAVDLDAASYDSVVAALKLPKKTEAEQAARRRAIESASKPAAEVPLGTAELAAEVLGAIEALRTITIPQAASDLAVALAMAEAARSGAIENVNANLPAIHDPAWVTEIEAKLKKVQS
jgi:formiminotetrahydrofolate cyclodeaminase